MEQSTLQFDCLLFDLDDTLYPSSTGIATACRKNIDEFLAQVFGFSREVVPSLRTQFYKTNGSTLAGLRKLGYEVDADEYHSFVHGNLPYEVIEADPALRSILMSMPQRKLVFTNSDKIHACKALKRLGLEDCFEDIICFESLNMAYPFNQQIDECKPSTSPVFIKPSIEAMKRAITIANVDPQRTLFFDDNVRNIAGAKEAGLNTVLVGSSVKNEGADYALGSIHNVREVIPEIWIETTKYIGCDEFGSSIAEVHSIEATPVPEIWVETTKYIGCDKFGDSIAEVNSIEATPVVVT
uniref:Uncharacterized protein n=1 Tax=Picea sitchensis TaxID=3332 RepID=B8LNH3_PICSI|nr:unknown [Picea sitchensis]